MPVVVQIGTTKGNKTTYVTIGKGILDQFGKTTIRYSGSIAKGKTVRALVDGKALAKIVR